MKYTLWPASLSDQDRKLIVELSAKMKAALSLGRHRALNPRDVTGATVKALEQRGLITVSCPAGIWSARDRREGKATLTEEGRRIAELLTTI